MKTKYKLSQLSLLTIFFQILMGLFSATMFWLVIGAYGKYVFLWYHFGMGMICVGGIVGLIKYRKNVKMIIIIIIAVIGAEIIAVQWDTWYVNILSYIYNNEFKDHPEVIAFYDRYEDIEIYSPNEEYIRYMHTFTDSNVITLNIRHGLDYPEHEMIIYCEVGNYSVSENILNYLKNYDCLEDQYP